MSCHAAIDTLTAEVAEIRNTIDTVAADDDEASKGYWAAGANAMLKALRRDLNTLIDQISDANDALYVKVLKMDPIAVAKHRKEHPNG